MPQRYADRVAVIIAVIVVALLVVFWPSVRQPGRLFSQASFFKQVGSDGSNVGKTTLTPGLDIVGGTSLLYQIKQPSGTLIPNLAEEVMKALKRRVDPNGVLNLVWRPQGANRLEIQMPLTAASGEGEKRQKALDAARAQLEATNVDVAGLVDALEAKNGKTRADFDKALAAAPAGIKPLLAALAEAHDALAKATETGDIPAASAARKRYEQAQKDLARTHLTPAEVDRTLALKESKDRELARLRQVAAAVPGRAEALEAYVKASEALAQGGGPESAADLKRLLRGSGVLEFHIVPTPGGDIEFAEYERMEKQLKEDGPQVKAGDQYRWFEDEKPERVTEIIQAIEGKEGRAREDELAKHAGELSTQRRQFANRMAATYDEMRQARAAGNADAAAQAAQRYNQFREDLAKQFNYVLHGDRYWLLASIKPEDSLDRNTGKWALAAAWLSRPEGAIVVNFKFDTPGGGFFGDLTSRHVGKSMAIMLDQKVISAPNIRSAIVGGTGIIEGGGSGGFSQTEGDYLVRTLSAGSLPAQLDEEPIRERTVGPQLGEDNLRAGLVACALGLVVVAVFLIGYYYLSGLVAYVAVLLNILIILGAMAAFGASFTLPGIAAIVLTVGTAVDANVLIFERLREEQQRGLSIRMAVRNAYDRAFSAIFDSNMTTLITSVFLILFGTEEVRGFGITLVIGICASMFTALFVTKTIFGLLIDRAGIRKLGSLPLSYPKWDQMLRPNINWMRLIWPLAAFSVIAITLGCGLFVNYLRKGQMFDIEFASGTAVTFEVKQEMKQKELRDLLEDASRKNPNVLPAPGVVRVGQEGTLWELTTPNADSAAVRKLLIDLLGEGTGGKNILKAEQPSRFLGVGQPLEAVYKPTDAAAAIAPPATTGPATTEPATASAATAAPATGPATTKPSGPVIIPLTDTTLANADLWPTPAAADVGKGYPGGAAIVLRGLDPDLSADQIKDRLKRQLLQAHDAETTTLAATAARNFTVVTGRGAAEPADHAVILFANPDLPYEKDKDKWATNLVGPMWRLVNEAIDKPAELRQVTRFDASVAHDTQRDALIALTLSIIAIMAYIWVRFGNLKYGTATVVALVHDVLFTLAAIGFAHALSGTAIGDFFQLQPFRINVTLVAGILTVMGFSMLDTIVVFDRVRELRGKYGHLSARVINDAINQTLSRTLLTAGTTIVSIAIMYFIGGPGIHGFTFVLFIGILVGTYSSIAIASPVLLIGRESGQDAASRERPAGSLQRATT